MSSQPEPFVTFEVWGDPVPKGSVQALAVMQRGPDGRMVPVLKDGRPVINVQHGDKNQRARMVSWKHEIIRAAQQAMRAVELGPVDGPIAIEATFFRRRPKAHYGTGRNKGVVKDSAAGYPATEPDVDKLARGLFDALKGVVWVDDSRVVDALVRKRYGGREGVAVRVWAMGGLMTDVVALGEDEAQLTLQLL